MPRATELLSTLLGATERRHLLWLVVAFGLIGLFETAGVASIAPFMAVLVDPEKAREGRVLGVIYRFLDPSSDRQFVLAVGACVMLFILVSNMLTAVVTWLASRFVFGQQHRIAQRLLAYYLHLPYTEFLRRNTSDLVKTLFLTNNQVVAGILMPAVQAFGRLIVAVMIVVLLAIFDPALSLSMGAAVAGAYVLIYTRARRFLLRLGRSLADADLERSKIAGEALNGLREVRMYGAEDVYRRRFAQPSGLYARAQTAGEMIATLPRNALEVIAFACLLGVTSYVFDKYGNNANEALPVVALYGFAAYRLMGAVQVVFNGLARVRFNWPALEILADEMRRTLSETSDAATTARPLPMEIAVEVSGLSFSYVPGQPVLDGLSVTIPAGYAVGIVGLSGSGKSTFMDVLLGFLDAERGSIRIDGVELGPTNARNWRASIGYVAQTAYLLDGTIAENIAFGVSPEAIDIEAVRRAARRARIDQFVAGLEKGYSTVVGERGVRLSGGQRQRIAIARALYRDPPIVVLDEATNALDNVTEAQVTEAVHDLRGRKTLVMIAHRLMTIRECDFILVFSGGRIVGRGSYDELLAGCEAFRELARQAERPAGEQADDADASRLVATP